MGYPTSDTPLFELGQCVMTAGVAAWLASKDNSVFVPALRAKILPRMFVKHEHGDWGTVPPEDAALNREAIINGSRIMSVYSIWGTTIWIITEADRSVTTALLPEEY